MFKNLSKGGERFLNGC